MSTVTNMGVEDYGNLWQQYGTGTGTGNLEWGNQTSGGNTIYIQQPNTSPDLWQTYPNTITLPNVNNNQYSFHPPPKSVADQIKDIKELEDRKKELGLEDFHIIIEQDHSFFNYNYTFLTETEMNYLKKYSIITNEIKDIFAFEAMLVAVEGKTANLILTGTNEKYETLDDLRKDHLILKLAGIKE